MYRDSHMRTCFRFLHKGPERPHNHKDTACFPEPPFSWALDHGNLLEVPQQQRCSCPSFFGLGFGDSLVQTFWLLSGLLFYLSGLCLYSLLVGFWAIRHEPPSTPKMASDSPLHGPIIIPFAAISLGILFLI